ncbi:MAG: [Fe-S]-binding protein [Planctomycetota bacterium]|nr:MAG: [Fe-S]-binding protein [Planctomycetota bacterium]
MTTSRETTWFRSPEERGAGAPRATPEFPCPAPAAAGVDRRAFLRLVGFSFAAASVSACSRGPAQTALTHTGTPEDMLAGKAYWIASTSWADGSGGGVLVRCRDGRPVKLEGNPEHPLNRGGLTASTQASLLSLYDDQRIDGPLLDGQPVSWDALDQAVMQHLDAITAAGGTVRLLSSTLTGPSTRAWIDRFVAAAPGRAQVVYDALSCSAQLDAYEAAYGVRALPRHDLAAAKLLAVFDADPLGTWISPAEYARDYASARKPDGPQADMSRHWQFEARMSLTGTRADRRVRVAPSETAPALAQLAAALAAHAGVPLPGPAPADDALRPELRAALGELADELWQRRRDGLVLCGSNDRDAQLITCWINELLGNQGRTWHLDSPSHQRQGDDRAVEALRQELQAGDVDLLITAGCNPAYDLPGMAEAIATAGAHVSLAGLADETSALASMICPEPHELERWDDAEPRAGLFCTSQPTLPPLRDTRSLRASLARWMGDARDDRELLKAHWREQLDARRPDHELPFEIWFNQVLERGFVQLPAAPVQQPGAFSDATLGQALGAVAAAAATDPAAGSDELRVLLYPKVGLLDGRGAHNPWLQELPDPVTKTTWDNHADLSPATAQRLGLSDGDMIRLSCTDDPSLPALELPVLTQPGQADDVVAVALGYGRAGTDRFTNIGPEWIEAEATVQPGDTIGVNAAPWLSFRDGAFATDTRRASVAATGARREAACTQDHHSLAVPEHLAPKRGAVRDAVHLVALPDLHATGAHGAGESHGGDVELWADDHKPRGHHWGLAIDLTACTGCSACVIGCQAENNVPVVGRDEVRRHREMSWLRIDRYYADKGDGDVDVVHQPLMCQHCGHAPCETVCPVLATMHSNEGLNTQVYNRCVGTRYCANNCPYKTRRFNWFEYGKPDRMQNMALNPDVTIRSRGIMEKCSMCVQRIQEAKADAKRRGEPLADGDIQTACQQSCPSNAIVFGDISDPHSEVSRLASAPRAYTVLEELNLKPGVRYLADVRNTEGAKG